MKDKEKDSLVYLKLNYEESLDAKKRILQSQRGFLVLNKILRNFTSLKDEELVLKSKFQRKLKELASNIRTLQTRIPEVDLPDKLKKDKKERHRLRVTDEDDYKPVLKSSQPSSYDDDIESQLREIQEKLNQLS